MVAAGSKAFFESIEVPGIKSVSIEASPGHVHITLTACEGANLERLQKRYLDACLSQIPLGQEITISIVDLAFQ